MSIRLMTRVWERSQAKGSALLVLLALADSANDEGYCWPSMQTIAKKARIDKRQVIRVVKDLILLEEIRVQHRVKNGVKTSNIYWITLGDSDKMSPPVGGSDTDTTTGSGTDVTRVVVQESLKSSINHQVKSSTDKEEEVKRPGIFKYYEDNIGSLTGVISDNLIQAEKDYTTAWVQDAIKAAAEYGAHNWKYIEAILRNWKTNGRKGKGMKKELAAHVGADYAKYNNTDD